jgi:exopolysaccharide production protein ExoY
MALPNTQVRRSVTDVRSERARHPHPVARRDHTPRELAVPVPVRAVGQLRMQRVFDVIVAIVAVIILLIPGLLIAALVKLTSRGPVFFTQARVGRGGELFTVYKFRTMEDGTHGALLSDAAAAAAYRDNDFKLPPNDPRITRLGRFLRKTSLDEVPQLLNVLKGEMSIVGVRPLLADELAIRPSLDQALYRGMRPGMTGLWQVRGRSTVGKTDRLELDRTYLQNWSVWGDVKIAAKTPFALLKIGHAH